MNQVGRIGLEDIEAWAFGSLAGYTLRDIPWTPRLGIQVDASSGDRNLTDNKLNTFNPLFPNGYYVTLAGLHGLREFHPREALGDATPARKAQTDGSRWHAMARIHGGCGVYAARHSCCGHGWASRPL